MRTKEAAIYSEPEHQYSQALEMKELVSHYSGTMEQLKDRAVARARTCDSFDGMCVALMPVYEAEHSLLLMLHKHYVALRKLDENY